MVRRRLPFLLLAALLLAATLAGALLTWRASHHRAHQAAEVQASQAAGALRTSFGSATASVNDLRGLFDASSEVTAAEFDVFARPLIGREGLSRVVWVRRVRPHQRAAYEREHAPVISPGAGSFGPAAPGATTHPLTYAATRSAIRLPIGVDVGGEPRRRAALRAAARSGTTLATPPMSVLPGTDPAILFFQAVYRDGVRPRSAAQRNATLEGYVAGVFAVRDLVRAARAALPEDAVLRIADGPALLAGPARPVDGPRETVEVAGREWTVGVAHHDPDATLPLTVLLAGLALTGLALVLGEVIARRDRFARRAVQAATAQLRASRRDYRALAENSPDVVARYDPDHRCVYMNAAATRATGLPPEAFVGRTSAEAGMPPHAARALDAALDAVFAGEEAEIEFGVPEADGPRWIHARLAPERGPDGSVEHALALSRDVTRQRRVEAALREGQERYRSLVAAMGDGVIVLGTDGRVSSCNRAAEAILGLPAGRVVGRTMTDPRWRRPVREDGEPLAAAEQPGMATLRTGAAQRDTVMGIHTPKGELRWISVSTEPLDTSVTGDDAAVVCCFVDISARLAAEREQSALRRVATLVAAQASPHGIFSAVAQEAARLLEADAASVIRVDDMRAVGTAVGFWSTTGAGDAIAGAEVPLSAGAVCARVAATGRRARLERPAPGDPVPCLLGGAYRSVVGAPILVDGDLWGVIVAGAGGAEPLAAGAEQRLEGFAELAGLAVVSADARGQLATLAATDHLTGLWNRRAFDEQLSAEVQRALRHGRPLGLVMLDIDHFKHVNDTHGHSAGDIVLVELARRLRAAARHGETVARIGGEEFAWILTESDGDAALAAAERARAAVARDPFPAVGPLTASAGVCDLAAAGSGAELLRLADAALYQAKAQGRDRVVRHRRAEAAAAR